MSKYLSHTLVGLLLGIVAASAGQTNTNSPSQGGTLTVQEALQSGPAAIRMHSLFLLMQGNVDGEIDASYLPGLKACSEDPAAPVRAITARILGEHYVKGHNSPNTEAVDLLHKLSKDDSEDVRYSVAYYGLTNLKEKSDGVLQTLLDLAATNRNPGLYDKLVKSLKPNTARVTELLDKKLEKDNAIAYFEIYRDFTGNPPPNADKFMEMPSTKPRLFVVKGRSNDVALDKKSLMATLKSDDHPQPNVSVSGSDGDYIFLIKTLLTKEYISVEAALEDNPTFSIAQDMWLTPELEVQFESVITTQKR